MKEAELFQDFNGYGHQEGVKTWQELSNQITTVLGVGGGEQIMQPRKIKMTIDWSQLVENIKFKYFNVLKTNSLNSPLNENLKLWLQSMSPLSSPCMSLVSDAWGHTLSLIHPYNIVMYYYMGPTLKVWQINDSCQNFQLNWNVGNPVVIMCIGWVEIDIFDQL